MTFSTASVTPDRWLAALTVASLTTPSPKLNSCVSDWPDRNLKRLIFGRIYPPSGNRIGFNVLIVVV
jgi:hypothetical protein